MTGPFATEAEARAAARVLGGPPQPGSSILTETQNRLMLAAACQDAGLDLGAYDVKVLNWLGGWEDANCAVVADLITRARAAAAGDTRQLAAIRAVLAAFDWEHGDRQRALEEIGRLADGAPR